MLESREQPQEITDQQIDIKNPSKRVEELQIPEVESRFITPETRIIPEAYEHPKIFLGEDNVGFWPPVVFSFNGRTIKASPEFMTARDGGCRMQISFEQDGNSIGKTETWYLAPDWVVTDRKVEEEFRNQGLGVLLFALTSDLARHVEFSSEGSHIRVEIGQPALARLLIDQNWLNEHGLEKFCHPNKGNLGFFPATEKDEKILNMMLLESEKHRGIEGSGERYAFDLETKEPLHLGIKDISKRLVLKRPVF